MTTAFVAAYCLPMPRLSEARKLQETMSFALNEMICKIPEPLERIGCNEIFVSVQPRDWEDETQVGRMTWEPSTGICTITIDVDAVDPVEVMLHEYGHLLMQDKIYKHLLSVLYKGGVNEMALDAELYSLEMIHEEHVVQGYAESMMRYLRRVAEGYV